MSSHSSTTILGRALMAPAFEANRHRTLATVASRTLACSMSQLSSVTTPILASTSTDREARRVAPRSPTPWESAGSITKPEESMAVRERRAAD
jgi:hypothetical protein